MAKKVRLIPADREELKRLITLVAHHQELAAQLDSQLSSLLLTRYRVDLKNEHWTLNLDNGVLTREPANPSHPA